MMNPPHYWSKLRFHGLLSRRSHGDSGHVRTDGDDARIPMALAHGLNAKLMRLLYVLLFTLIMSLPLDRAWSREEAFDFENTEIQTVIKKTSVLTGLTFIFDPERIKGKITLLLPGKVSSEEALRLLQSALALHGYSLLRQDESVWIMPAEQAVSIEVVPLDYADAGELAWTLAQIAPYGVRIVPYYPTNSLIIYGDPQAVKALNPIVKGKGNIKEPAPFEGMPR